MIFRKTKNKVEDKVAEKVAVKVFDDFTKKKPVLKTSTIKDIIANPDDYELIAKVVDGEVVIRIRKQQYAIAPTYHSQKHIIAAPNGDLYFKSDES